MPNVDDEGITRRWTSEDGMRMQERAKELEQDNQALRKLVENGDIGRKALLNKVEVLEGKLADSMDWGC